jgi:hypothetical protein
LVDEGRKAVTTTNTNAMASPICSWGCRAAGRLAACESDRPPDHHRLCPYAPGFVGRVFPDAAKIVLMQDNLNTHKPASLYEAFPAVEARRLVERFEWHFESLSTAVGSTWPNRNSACSRRSALDRRIADKQILAHEFDAWQDHRNKHHAKANCQFKTADARVKLKRLYPTVPSVPVTCATRSTAHQATVHCTGLR